MAIQATSEIRVITEPEREVRARLGRLLAAIHEGARRALDLRRLRDDFRNRLLALNRVHPEFAAANTRQVATWWSYLAGLTGVWFGDIFLSWPSSTYFATRFVEAGPRGVFVWCVMLPTIIFLVELMVASQRHALRERALDGVPSLYYLLTILGLLLVIVVPGLVAATQLALAATSIEGLGSFANRLRVVSVTAISAVLHAVVVFGSGKAFYDAKGYMLYRMQAGRLVRRASAVDRRRSRTERRALRLFTAYRTERAQAITEHPQTAFEDGPFQRVVVDLINGQEASGAEATQAGAPAAPVSAPSTAAAAAAYSLPSPSEPKASTAAAPPAAGREASRRSDSLAAAGAGDAVMPAVTDARVRDAEAEVRP